MKVYVKKSLLIKNGYVVLNNEIKKADILIENGKVKQIESYINANCKTIDAKGLYILPGLIDMHVHLREPGFEGKEDIESGSKAAVAGGFTQICCMPNTNPICDSKTVVSYIKEKAKKVNLCKVNPIGAITKGEKGEELAAIGEMYEEGVVAISDDGKSVMNSNLMRHAMEYASSFNLKCLCHCEDANLVDGGVVNEGYNSTISGLKGSIRAAEDIMISREVCLSASLNIPVHICHVSTYTGVAIIRAAKALGVQVTCETCPHYFTLTDDVVVDYDTKNKVNPPLREEKDVDAIKEGLKDGTIDCIVTDHAPHSYADKNTDYMSAPFGISGIETSFALSYTYLVKSGVMNLFELVNKMSTKPAKILNLEGGVIKVGKPADLTIVNLDEKYKINVSKFVSKGKNSPFDGFEVYGKVNYTIVDGEIKYSL